MSILGDISRFISKGVDRVKNVFKPNTVEKKDTLNDEINKTESLTGTSNNDVLFSDTGQNQLQNAIAKFQTNIQSNKLTQTPSATLSPVAQETQDKWVDDNTPWYRKTALVSDVVNMYEDITGKIRDTTHNRGKNVSELVDDAIEVGNDIKDWNKKRENSKNAEREYNKNKQNIYLAATIGGGRNNRAEVLSVADEDRYRASLAHRTNELNYLDDSGDINAYNNALNSMYDEMKGYFGTSLEQYITDEDKISKLSQLPELKSYKSKYEPTKEQFFAFLETEGYNYNLQQDINKKYGLTREQTEEEKNITSDAIHMTDELISASLDRISAIDGSKAQYAANNFRSGLEDQITRTYIHLEPIFELEKDILLIPEDERSDSEKRIITSANNARTWMKQLAKNYSDWFNRIVDETLDEKGEITDALDYFKDGKTLNEVLKAGGLDMLMSRRINDNMVLSDTAVYHMSPIDIAEKFANDELYRYHKENETNGIKRAWNAVEYWGRPIGALLSEGGQFVLATVGSDPIHNFGNLINKGIWGSPYNTYLDMDFSMGKMIETNDSLARRNIKKYTYQFLEYAPEGLANVAPYTRILRWASPGLITQSLRQIGNAAKVFRRIKALENVNEVRKSLQPINTALKGLERVGAVGEQRANINSRNKRIWNIIDRALAQFSVGQLMDAQLSVFDTEPYSDTSFWLSAIGAIGLDILPEAKSMRGVLRNGTKGGNALWKTTGVWDLVDFISQSEDNALAVAKAMGKKYANFTEQDLRNYVRKFAEISDAAETVYKQLNAAQKKAIGDWTKELMYNYVKQTYGASSNIGKQVRQILINKNTSPADIIKYVGAIPGRVTFGPYSSTITLKHGTNVGIVSKAKDGWYDVRLDIVDGGFDRGIKNGFTASDINKISSIEGFDDIAKNKNKFFERVIEKKGDKEIEKYYLKDKGLDRFGLKKESLTLESLGVSLSEAEDVREILKEKMKDLSGKNISDDTINKLADGGGYNEVVSKIKEVLC